MANPVHELGNLAKKFGRELSDKSYLPRKAKTRSFLKENNIVGLNVTNPDDAGFGQARTKMSLSSSADNAHYWGIKKEDGSYDIIPNLNKKYTDDTHFSSGQFLFSSNYDPYSHENEDIFETAHILSKDLTSIVPANIKLAENGEMHVIKSGELDITGRMAGKKKSARSIKTYEDFKKQIDSLKNDEFEEKDPGSPHAPDAPNANVEENQRKEAQQKIETAHVQANIQNKEIEDTAEKSAEDNGTPVKELKDQKNSTIEQYSKNEAVVQEEVGQGKISEEEAQERLGATENKNNSGGLWGFVKNHKTMSGIGAFAAYEVLSGNGGQKSNAELYSDPYN